MYLVDCVHVLYIHNRILNVHNRICIHCRVTSAVKLRILQGYKSCRLSKTCIVAYTQRILGHVLPGCARFQSQPAALVESDGANLPGYHQCPSCVIHVLVVCTTVRVGISILTSYLFSTNAYTCLRRSLQAKLIEW